METKSQPRAGAVSLSAIVLAGGRSSRMGQDKALLPIQGVPLLQLVCCVASALCDPVYVVTPWPERYQHLLPPTCQFIREVSLPGESKGDVKKRQGSRGAEGQGGSNRSDFGVTLRQAQGGDAQSNADAYGSPMDKFRGLKLSGRGNSFSPAQEPLCPPASSVTSSSSKVTLPLFAKVPSKGNLCSDFPLPHGPLVGFAQGLAQVQTDWVLLLACDLPRLRVEVLQDWATGLDSVGEEAIALLTHHAKGWNPLCGFYRRSCLPALIDFINQGGRSFQHWLGQHPVQLLPLPDAQMLFNCNTPADLASLETFS